MVDLGTSPSYVDVCRHSRVILQDTKCKKCLAAGRTCRINLVHGVACNRCTNSSVGCSFAAKQHSSGPNWTYDQRRWILVHWARRATADAAHPSEVSAPFENDFSPPTWFVEGLQAARGKDAETTKKRSKRLRADSPVGQKRRAMVAPGTDSEPDTRSAKVATQVKRKRARRSRSAAVKRDLGSSESDREGDDSQAEEGKRFTDRRPIKRPRTDSRASSAVPAPSSKCHTFNTTRIYQLIL